MLVNVRTEQPGTQLATHEEMNEFCLRHGQLIIPQELKESEVSTLDKHVEKLIRLAREDETLDGFQRRRLLASFQTTRRMFAQAKKQQSRRSLRVRLMED